MSSNSASIREFETQPAAASRRMHFLVPVLIGLLAPLLTLCIIDARAVANLSVMVNIYLFALFVIATAAFVISVFDQGDVTKVVFDKDAKEVTIERTGLLAKKFVTLPFSEIAAVRVETRFDDDGYKTSVPLMTLSTREVVPLPAGTGEVEIAAIRQIIGR